MRWYYDIGRKVWPYEIWHFLFHDHRTAAGPSLAEFQRGEIAPPAMRRDTVSRGGFPIGAITKWA